MRVDQHRQELAPEQTREHLDVYKEVRPRSDPSAAIGRDAAARHDHVDVGMVRERRAPGVQHRGDADVGAEGACHADTVLWPTVWLSRLAASSAANHVVRCDGKSDGGMARSPTDGG